MITFNNTPREKHEHVQKVSIVNYQFTERLLCHERKLKSTLRRVHTNYRNENDKVNFFTKEQVENAPMGYKE